MGSCQRGGTFGQQYTHRGGVASSVKENPLTSPLYNFRLAPEAIWLIINTVLGTALVELAAQLLNWQSNGFGDLETWATGFAFGLARTVIGAVLAAATGGQFLKPGEKPVNPTPG